MTIKENAIKNKTILYYFVDNNDKKEALVIYCKDKEIMDAINDNIIIEHNSAFDEAIKSQATANIYGTSIISVKDK